MTLPIPLLQSLQGIAGFDEKAFIAVHESGEHVTSIRFNPAKTNFDIAKALPLGEGLGGAVPWCSSGYYLHARPSFTFDPLFHAGTYYVQEASSMFIEQALVQTVDLSQPLRILDLCAAPGGKSTLLQSLISQDSLLVSNDTIKSRAAILEENISKWGAANIVVTNNDPAHFARLENYFDVIVIDAPCSGSGLFRRDPAAIDEWSENNVQLCSQRQQRIIADVWPALKQDGVLIYSTCSYSKQEDEDMLDWMMERLQAESIKLTVNVDWHIIETASQKHHAYGYRFYPDKLAGEGFFTAVLQKRDGGSFAGMKPGKPAVEILTKIEAANVSPWLNADVGLVLFKQNEVIIALPSCLQKEIPVLQSALYIKKAGVTAGKLAGNNLVPDHQLAVSSIINKNIIAIDLNRQEAIQYLQRGNMRINTNHRGWMLVSYKGYNLGWIKVMPNRFNNYYPKEWRILKQSE